MKLHPTQNYEKQVSILQLSKQELRDGDKRGKDKTKSKQTKNPHHNKTTPQMQRKSRKEPENQARGKTHILM